MLCKVKVCLAILGYTLCQFMSYQPLSCQCMPCHVIPCNIELCCLCLCHIYYVVAVCVVQMEITSDRCLCDTS